MTGSGALLIISAVFLILSSDAMVVSESLPPMGSPGALKKAVSHPPDLKARWASSARKKMGIETPASDTVSVAISVHPLGLRAEIMPAVIPMHEAIIMASTASSMVAGNLTLISSMTGFFFMLVPRLPWLTSERYLPNWT